MTSGAAPLAPSACPLVYQWGEQAWRVGCVSVPGPSCGAAELIGNPAVGLNAALVCAPRSVASTAAQRFY